MTTAELELPAVSTANRRTNTTMKAPVYHDPGKYAWEDKPRPAIQVPGDAVVRITTSTSKPRILPAAQRTHRKQWRPSLQTGLNVRNGQHKYKHLNYRSNHYACQK